LPNWFHIGGEFRGRLEVPTGIGFTGTNDFYYLWRLRVNLGIKPKNWLLFYGEMQDSRIFFNHHIGTVNPYEVKWTLWQAFPQVGSSETGWVDALAGRQVLRFGDERLIGPSEWLNVGRTFNVARVDLHHPLSITTLNLTDRQDRWAHLPSPRGRAMPAWARLFAR
jgi:hypothetical protein